MITRNWITDYIQNYVDTKLRRFKAIFNSRTSTVAPTTSDIPNGSYKIWHNSTDGTTNLYYNNNGTLVSNSVDGESTLGDYVKSYRRNKRFDYFNDFIGNITSAAVSANTNDLVFSQATSSSFLGVTPTNKNQVGIMGVQHNPSPSTVAGVTYSTANNILILSGGSWSAETYIAIHTLSNSSVRYQYYFGFWDTFALDQSNGVYFLYDEGGISVGSTAALYWQTVTASAATRTFNNSLVQNTVTVDAWVKLRIEINAAGTSAAFYINDVLVSTHTTNISTTNPMGFGLYSRKSAGSGSFISVYTDYISVQSEFTTNR